MREFFEKKHHIYDTVFCKQELVATEIFNFYINKGYQVAVSTVEITTGTNGKQAVKKLDILEEFTEDEYMEDEYMEDAKRDALFRKELDKIKPNF